jgi:hypothetical protein
MIGSGSGSGAAPAGRATPVTEGLPGSAAGYGALLWAQQPMGGGPA